MSPTEAETPASCPVDHKSREAWLKQAKAQNIPAQHPPIPTPSSPSSPLQTASSCDSSQLDPSTSTPQDKLSHISKAIGATRLGQDREISTIPRALSPLSTSLSLQGKAANNEVETGSDQKTGNWIYPSEKMFFDAMKRKSYNPDSADMKTIVPIHNAVNERAWMEIKQWEKGRGSEDCGGPRLTSFSGLSTALTPRARMRTFLGYKPPFDRHDWVVDRCGTQVDYVIDFYAGRDEKVPGKELNFYLDVRPKLNSFEGVKMRALRLFGL